MSALKICVETIGVDQEATAAVYNNIGTLYFKSGFDERAREMHMEALEARRKVFGEDHYETAQSHANLALVFVKSGEINAARRHFTEALDIYEDYLDVARYSYETVAANFRDVLESLDDQRAIVALNARLAAHPAQ
ncbi:tetratricopeptide repeat protein [Akkermansiaceae bacterium]|nr:tetratricopeptide repeat protein [Akkermansiaceae bacterium]